MLENEGEVKEQHDIPKPTSLIPGNDKIVADALSVIKNKYKPEEVEKNFYKVLSEAMDIGYDTYLKYEREAKEKTIKAIEEKVLEGQDREKHDKRCQGFQKAPT